MPRKKNDNPRIFASNMTGAGARNVTRRVMTSMNSESGSPARDGVIWLNRIARTRQIRAMLKNGEKDWRRYYRWYAGEQWNDRGEEGGALNSDNARETATVNKTGSIVNTIAPFLVNGEIKFLLKPRRPGDVESAKIQQSLLNYEWRERNMTRTIRAAVRDLCIIGHSVIKTGYAVEVDTARDPEKEDINYADYVRRDSPWIERVNPLNFLHDLSARDNTLHTARWVAEIFFQPLADVLVNDRYDKKALDLIWSGVHTPTTQAAFEIEARATTSPLSSPQLDAWGSPEDMLVVLIEIWDKKYRNRMIYADGVPVPLLAEPWPYDYLDNFPYLMANYIHVPNNPYGIGVPRWIEDQQMQLNRMRSNQFNWVRANQPKFIGVNLEPAERTKFTDGGAGTIIDAEPGAIAPIPEAKLSVDFDRVELRIEADMQEMTGADAILQGRSLGDRTTASEISTRTRVTTLKLDDIRANVEDQVRETATQVLQHLKAFKTQEGVIEIVGPEGAFWQPYTPAEIQADLDVEVEYFSAPKTDPALEKQQALQVLQIAIQAIPLLAESGAPNTIDAVQLFGWIFDRFGEKDISRFFRPSPPPPLQLTEGGEGGGLPPALAGQFAPAPVGQTPGFSSPEEGNTVEDLLQQLRGTLQ